MAVDPKEINFGFPMVDKQEPFSDNQIPISTQWTLDATGEAGRTAITSVYMITCPTTGSKGSGFLLSNGYIITNVHVINGEKLDKICATSASDQKINFTQVHFDTERDIAILKPSVQQKGGLELDLSETMKVGESVYTWGYPLGHNDPSPLLSVGYLSGFKSHQELHGCPLRLMQDEKTNLSDLNKNLNEIGVIKDGNTDKFRIFYRRKADNILDVFVLEGNEVKDTFSSLNFNGQLLTDSEATKKVYMFVYSAVTQHQGHTTFSKVGTQKRLVVNGAFNSGNSGGGLFKANEKKVIGIVVNKHAPVLNKFQQSAIEALANNQGGFVYTATDENGTQKTVVESQIVAELLNSFRGMVQVVIGEAICSTELIKVLISFSNYNCQEAIKKEGEKKHDEAIALLLEAENMVVPYKPTDEVLMLIYFNLGKLYLSKSKIVEAHSALLKSEAICKVQPQTSQNQQNYLTIVK